MAEVAGVVPDALDDALDEAAAAEIIAARGPGRWQFSHALVAETLVEALLSVRARLHKQAAEALERTFAADPRRRCPTSRATGRRPASTPRRARWTPPCARRARPRRGWPSPTPPRPTPRRYPLGQRRRATRAAAPTCWCCRARPGCARMIGRARSRRAAPRSASWPTRSATARWARARPWPTAPRSCRAGSTPRW
ncbi:MAG: hypothetical protein U1F43_34890 [Myxococcota bacterium]